MNDRLIEDLRDFKDNEPDSYHDKLIEQAIAEIERLRGVEADARRYRWLRQCSPIRSDRTMYVQAGEYVKGVFQRTIYPTGAELDEAIDAAIAASRSTGAADVGED